jgi:hypothetical protein
MMKPVTESMLVIMKEFEAKLMAKMDACEAKMLAAIITCLGKPEGSRECKELDPGMMQCVGEHQEVPKGEAAVMPVGRLRKRRRDRNLASGRCQNLKGRIQASFASWKRLTVAYRKMTCHARVAWHKRNIVRKDCTRAKVEQATQRIKPLRKSLQTHHEEKGEQRI